jgi:hypothetical protein
MKMWTSYYVDYRRIAEQSHQQLQTVTLPEIVTVLNLIDLQNGEMSGELVNRFFSLQHQMFTQTTTTVVFAAMAAEGFIFDYAAQRLSADQVKYIDRLSLVGKWLEIPRLVTGMALPKGDRGLKLLRQLRDHRNALVHYKSREIDVGKGEADPVQFALSDQARGALLTLDALASELEAIDPTSQAAARIGSNSEARWQLTAREVEPW